MKSRSNARKNSGVEKIVVGQRGNARKSNGGEKSAVEQLRANLEETIAESDRLRVEMVSLQAENDRLRSEAEKSRMEWILARRTLVLRIEALETELCSLSEEMYAR